MRTFVFVLGAIALIASAAPTSAQESDADARARTHFEAGRLHFEEGAYDRARAEFLRAWELSHRPALLINLATVEERLAEYAQAASRIRDYVAAVPDDPNRAQLERRIANLERLQRDRDTRGATAATPTPTPTPGEPAPAEPTPAPGGGGGDGLVIGGIVGLGVGGVGFVLQGVFGGLALSEDATLAEGCGATASCTEAQVADANTYAAVSDAMMAVGIAGVAAGAVLLILGLTSSGSGDSAALAPWVDPSGAGIVARGSF